MADLPTNALDERQKASAEWWRMEYKIPYLSASRFPYLRNDKVSEVAI